MPVPPARTTIDNRDGGNECPTPRNHHRLLREMFLTPCLLLLFVSSVEVTMSNYTKELWDQYSGLEKKMTGGGKYFGWLEEEKEEARMLLRRCLELKAKGKYDEEYIRTWLIGYLKRELEAHLRMVDAAIQEACKGQSRGWRENLANAWGDRCAPVFRKTRQLGSGWGRFELSSFEAKLKLWKGPIDYITVYRYYQEFRSRTNPTAAMLKMMGEGLKYALIGVATHVGMIGMRGRVGAAGSVKAKRARATLRRAFKMKEGAGEGRAQRPFGDFPRMKHWPIKKVRNWLQKNGFKVVKAPKVTEFGKTDPHGGSEIWFREGRLPGGKVEAVRVDARGHKVGSHIPKEQIQSYARKDVKVAAGDPRHMHKEVISAGEKQPYCAGGIQKNGKYWQPPSYDDTGKLSTGDHAATHVWLTP